MKSYKKIVFSILLITSLACGGTLSFGSRGTPPPPPPPTLTFTPTPTLIPLPTTTSLPSIVIQVETARFESGQLVIAGQLYGAPTDTVYQSVVTVTLLNSQKQILLEEKIPCAEPPHAPDAICAFTFSPAHPPVDVTDFGIRAQTYTHTGLILEGRAGSFPGASEILRTPTPFPVSQDDLWVEAWFERGFYSPETGSFLHASALYSDISVFDENFPNRELCAMITELREYESGQSTQIVLKEECRAANSQPDGENMLTISADFFFKPSGYSFVWIDSPDGRYRILEVSASVILKQDQQILDSTSASHRPIPVRVVSASLEPDLQANVTVETMAGQGETYEILLRVLQVEADLKETFWSGFFIFYPCILPGICEDYVIVGEVSQSITLLPGLYTQISSSYTTPPSDEIDNITVDYKMALFFEDIFIGNP